MDTSSLPRRAGLIFSAAALLFLSCTFRERSGLSGSGRPGEVRCGPDGVCRIVKPRSFAGACEAQENPLGVNAACYVCHIPFVKEELSRIHLRAEVGCIDCHGVSTGHANDEEIGATAPDITFRRNEINGFCRKCHKTHDVPARKVVEACKDGKVSAAEAVCTDCHGAHRISPPKRESGKGGKGNA